MRVTHDPAVDYAYIYLREVGAGQAVRTESVELEGLGELHLDIDRDGTLIGIEVPNASAALPAELLAAAETP